MLVSEDELVRFGDLHTKLVEQLGFLTRPVVSWNEVLVSRSLGLENLVGLGVGEKVEGGIPTGRLAIRAYVVRKVDSSFVKDDLNEVIRENLPDRNIPTDIIEVGNLSLFHHAGLHFSPQIPAGVGIGNATVTTEGTLGAWLTDGSEDYLLSCWHVVKSGTSSSADVVQPSQRYVGHCIARISVEAAPDMTGQTPSKVDAALAKREPNVVPGHFMLSLGEVTGIQPVTSIRMIPYPVKKSGLSSHITLGKVEDLKATMKLSVPGTAVQVTYEDQIAITADTSGLFSSFGDSGALVVNQENKAVGLLVGGGWPVPMVKVHVTIATPIERVLRELRQKGGLAKLDFYMYP
jgi:hypothetical protein